MLTRIDVQDVHRAYNLLRRRNADVSYILRVYERACMTEFVDASDADMVELIINEEQEAGEVRSQTSGGCASLH